MLGPARFLKGTHEGSAMEDDEVQAYDDLAYFVGVPFDQWSEKELREALRMEIRAKLAMRRMVVDGEVRAKLAETELAQRKKPGRKPKPKTMTLRDLIQMGGGRKRDKHHLSERERHQMLDFMDRHPSDAAGIDAYIAILHERLDRSVSLLRLRRTERTSMRNQVSRARKEFSRPRRNKSRRT